MLKLFLKEKKTGEIHEYGTDPYDSLMIQNDGSLHYVNTNTGKGTKHKKYVFVDESGDNPRDFGLRVVELGGTSAAGPYDLIEGIENIEEVKPVKYSPQWLDDIANDPDLAITRKDRIFG